MKLWDKIIGKFRKEENLERKYSVKLNLTEEQEEKVKVMKGNNLFWSWLWLYDPENGE